ncbi:MAG: mitochondrial fission ELM1 family protein, partial [Rhodospirillales bacterium]|nr:mitochondrial fission ELM1 family protein [Rhodospirillales bacterium]
AGEFDLIAAPRHDRPRSGANVVLITGAPHRLTRARLAAAAAEWRGRFDDLPKPWIALIVGGSTRRRRFTEAMARELAARASKMALKAGGSLLVTTSRRTGAATEALLAAVNAPARVHRWPGGEQGDKQGGGDNPYVGYLALADAVIVTGDSASMCSEACATAAPVYIFAPPALTIAKHARLHAELYEKGYARPLLGNPSGALESWSHPPLNAAEDVAAAIRSRLGI